MKCRIGILIISALVFQQAALAGTENRTIVGADPDLSQGAWEMRKGNYSEGIRLTYLGLRSAVSHRDRQAGLNNLCAGYAALGSFEKAIYICNLVLISNDQSWRAYNNRALAFFGAGELDKAQADVETGLSINPGSSKLQEAAELIQRGHEKLPRLKTALLNW